MAVETTKLATPMTEIPAVKAAVEVKVLLPKAKLKGVTAEVIKKAPPVPTLAVQAALAVPVNKVEAVKKNKRMDKDFLLEITGSLFLYSNLL